MADVNPPSHLIRTAFLAEAASASEAVCLVAETELDLAQLEPVWKGLTAKSALGTPGQSWGWLWTWWEVIGHGAWEGMGTPYVVTVLIDGAPAAIFPFVEVRARSGGWRLRRLHPMGYSGELDTPGLCEEPLVVIASGYEKVAETAVVRHLKRQMKTGRWDWTLVRHLDLGESHEPRTRGQKVKPGPAVTDLPTTWDAFRKSLSKSMRDNLAYYPRLMRREGHDFTIQLYGDVDGVDRAIDRLVDLHRQRANDPAVHVSRTDHLPGESQVRMLRTLMRRMVEESRGFVAVLKVDGEAVAAQAFIRSDMQLLAHYSGFDPRFSRYSPLLILQGEVLRWAIDQGLGELNLLFGGAQWQTRWNATPRSYESQSVVVSRRLSARARYGLYIALTALAAEARRGRMRKLWSVVQKAVSSGLGGMYEMHLMLARIAASPAAHHLVRVHR